MNGILALVIGNSSYFGIGALILSVFFAGTMLQGERMRRAEIREELAALADLNDATMQNVDRINTELREKDAQLVAQVRNRYTKIDSLNREVEEVVEKLDQTTTEIDETNTEGEEVREEIRKIPPLRLRPKSSSGRNR